MVSRRGEARLAETRRLHMNARKEGDTGQGPLLPHPSSLLPLPPPSSLLPRYLGQNFWSSAHGQEVKIIDLYRLADSEWTELLVPIGSKQVQQDSNEGQM